MALDPQLKAYADQLAAKGDPPRHTLTPESVRALQDTELASDLVGGVLRPEPVARVEERAIAGPAGALRLRIYTPAGHGPLAITVYFHGGGWVLGSLDTHDSHCRSIAIGAHTVVVSVGYRLAPEDRFPAAVEDCYAATHWVAEHAAELNGDAGRLAVAGDSAGGNLATVVALLARDRGGPHVSCQLLIYPITDLRMQSASYAEHADGPMLTRDDMVWFCDHYLRDREEVTNPYASPALAADLRGVAPALIVTAEYDPLRDEAERYGERLREAGVSTMVRRFNGLAHGFFGQDLLVDRARDAKVETITALREALAVCSPGAAALDGVS
jgi:acetyl esterase